MRHGRAKAARKTLQFFGRTIGLKAPYSILLDANFVAALFQYKILPFRSRIDRVLQTNTTGNNVNKFFVTQSAVDELQGILEVLQSKKHAKAEAFREALEFITTECATLKKAPTSESEESSSRDKVTPVQKDLLHYINHSKDHVYIVATQDEGLLDRLRKMGTVPILRLADNSVLLLENPSKYSQQQSKGMEKQKWINPLQDAERALVNLVKGPKTKPPSAQSTSTSTTSRQPKKAKGPNPLSCKRKRNSDDDQPKLSTSQKRRMRAKRPNDEAPPS